LDGLHGLVITGGADVDPARYGATAGEHTDRPRTDRDEWEIALTVGALRRGLPLLGICRGLQVLNVVLGGTLVQHLPDATAGTDGTDGTDPAEPVRHGGAPGEFVDHAVRIDPASRLGGIVGAHAIAASHHHQGIDRLAADLVATAWTADGLIEAVERSGPAWVLAVQWHPEVRGGQALFTGFVEVCSASYAGSPTSTVAGVG
jgi:putative glutamine amidotransferase